MKNLIIIAVMSISSVVSLFAQTDIPLAGFHAQLSEFPAVSEDTITATFTITDFSNQWSGMDLSDTMDLAVWKNCDRFKVIDIVSAFSNEITLKLLKGGNSNLVPGVCALVQEIHEVSHLISGITDSEKQCMDSYYRQQAIAASMIDDAVLDAVGMFLISVAGDTIAVDLSALHQGYSWNWDTSTGELVILSGTIDGGSNVANMHLEPRNTKITTTGIGSYTFEFPNGKAWESDDTYTIVPIDVKNDLSVSTINDTTIRIRIASSSGFFTNPAHDSIDIVIPTQLSESEIEAFGFIKNYTVTESDVTYHEAAITITESQISDLTHTIDTDTQLSDEEVQDIIGAMSSGNSETLISVEYKDSDGTIDYEVEDDLSLYDNTTSGFITSADDDDSDPTNELQLLSVSNDTIYLSDGGFVVIDTSVIGGLEEYVINNGGTLQSISIDSSFTDDFDAKIYTMSLSDGGGEVNFYNSFSPFARSFGSKLMWHNVADWKYGFGVYPSGSYKFEIGGGETNISELTINGNYTFPTTDGSDGQVQLTDGSGGLSWGNIDYGDIDNTPTIPSSIWTLNGSDAYYDDGGGVAINRTSAGGYALNLLGRANIADDKLNLFLNQAGNTTVTGASNIGIGYITLASLTTGAQNVALGGESLNGLTTGSNNMALGYRSMKSNQTGSSNVGIGYRSMQTMGVANVGNVGIGYFSLYSADNNFNIGVGQAAGFNAQGNTVAIGAYSGYQSTTGGIYIGFEAGRYNYSDNKLFIDNSSTASPLIEGDFSTNELTVNGELLVTDLVGGTPTKAIGRDATMQLVEYDIPDAGTTYAAGTSIYIVDGGSDPDTITNTAPSPFARNGADLFRNATDTEMGLMTATPTTTLDVHGGFNFTRTNAAANAVFAMDYGSGSQYSWFEPNYSSLDLKSASGGTFNLSVDTIQINGVLKDSDGVVNDGTKVMSADFSTNKAKWVDKWTEGYGSMAIYFSSQTITSSLEQKVNWDATVGDSKVVFASTSFNQMTPQSGGDDQFWTIRANVTVDNVANGEIMELIIKVDGFPISTKIIPINSTSQTLEIEREGLVDEDDDIEIFIKGDTNYRVIGGQFTMKKIY